ncbi:MAG: hypothetical protein Q8T09_16565 [Candidatus Melainabacteria bacterium]|nr:hypothetical protein [Candidatus Melainabacteria bacterium]
MLSEQTEEANVQTMTPLAIFAEDEYEPGMHRYKVSFDRKDNKVEYTFTVDARSIPCVSAADDQFSREALTDRTTSNLMQALLNFHEARQS